MCVADRRCDRDLSLAVEGRQRGKSRMPVKPIVLGEDRPRRFSEGELRAELAIVRVAGRIEDRERVCTPGQEDGDQHGLRRGCRSARDPLVECVQAELRGPVDGKRDAGRTGEERAPVQARARRQRHAGLDRGQPAACFCRRPS